MSEHLSRDGSSTCEEVCKNKVTGEGRKDKSCPCLGTLEMAVRKMEHRVVDEQSGTTQDFISVDAWCHCL